MLLLVLSGAGKVRWFRLEMLRRVWLGLVLELWVDLAWGLGVRCWKCARCLRLRSLACRVRRRWAIVPWEGWVRGFGLGVVEVDVDVVFVVAVGWEVGLFWLWVGVVGGLVGGCWIGLSVW